MDTSREPSGPMPEYATAAEAWEAIDRWLHAYRARHEEDERDGLEILLSDDYQDPEKAAPYWKDSYV